MFKKAVYTCCGYMGTITDPAAVVNDFMRDISKKKPASVTENSTRVFVSFTSAGNNLDAYTLPIAYKKYVVEV